MIVATESPVKFSALFAAAATTAATTTAAWLPELNEWLRAGASLVAIAAGLVTVAIGIRKWKNRKD